MDRWTLTLPQKSCAVREEMAYGLYLYGPTSFARCQLAMLSSRWTLLVFPSAPEVVKSSQVNAQCIDFDLTSNLR